MDQGGEYGHQEEETRRLCLPKAVKNGTRCQSETEVSQKFQGVLDQAGLGRESACLQCFTSHLEVQDPIAVPVPDPDPDLGGGGGVVGDTGMFRGGAAPRRTTLAGPEVPRAA